MALFLTPSETKRVYPKNQTFTLEELQSYVEGYIERIPLDGGRAMYVNEEARLTGLPKNTAASVWYWELYENADPDTYILGNAIIVGDLEEDDSPE